MSAGASPVFALVRIPRGGPRPSEADFVEALKKDRLSLRLPESNGYMEFETAGPYAILVDGSELDEYVAWEK